MSTPYRTQNEGEGLNLIKFGSVRFDPNPLCVEKEGEGDNIPSHPVTHSWGRPYIGSPVLE